MRLAAFGLLNMDTKARAVQDGRLLTYATRRDAAAEVWNSELSQPAKDFILSLIKPDPVHSSERAEQHRTYVEISRW